MLNIPPTSMAPAPSGQTAAALFYSGSRRAFTLTELIVAVAIVGILVAILVPGTGKTIENTRKVQCSANLKQVYMTIALYAQDNDGALPLGHDYTSNTDWGQKKSPLAAYAGSGDSLQKIAVCPTCRSTKPLVQDEFGQWVNNAYGYPYAYNYYVLPNSAGATPVRLTKINKPSLLVMMTDPVKGQGFGAGFAHPGDAKWSRVGTPHFGKSNVLWCDGHISLEDKKDIEGNIVLN